MKIKTSQFCSISRSKDWQNWLKEIDADLHDELLEVVSKRGCRAITKLMMDIYRSLIKDGHRDSFETFMKRRFPYMITDDREVRRRSHEIEEYNKDNFKNKEPKIIQPKIRSAENIEIFKDYRANILSFPQRLILDGDIETLESRVKKFIADKSGTDYIIVNDKAYIEYFLPQYKDIVEKIPIERREIHAYRMKMKQSEEQ